MKKLFKVNQTIDHDEDYYVLAENEDEAENYVSDNHERTYDIEFSYYTKEITPDSKHFDEDVNPINVDTGDEMEYVTVGEILKLLQNNYTPDTIIELCEEGELDMDDILKKIEEENKAKLYQETHQNKLEF